MRLYFIGMISAFVITVSAMAQDSGEISNTAERLLSSSSKLTVGGYGQVDFNRDINAGKSNNANIDVHRLVVLLGYTLSEKASFVTEIELEHVTEVYIEQAFLDYNIFGNTSLRTGLMLVPMGIINEYHEPTTFHGVERPAIHSNIVPTTWREIGIGINGLMADASLRYQLYMMNGFLSYNGSGVLKGSNAFRSGRQKGAESISSSPSFSGKLDWFGLSGLNIGAAGYIGKTQSTLYDGLENSDAVGNSRADSSVVDVAMFGLDARYRLGALQLRGEYIWSTIGNTDQYNTFTGKNLGKSIFGFYTEAAYDLFSLIEDAEGHLYPFIRYSEYDTHAKVGDVISKNPSYHKTIITTGLSWHLADGAALKADFQWLKDEGADRWSNALNLGLAVWF